MCTNAGEDKIIPKDAAFFLVPCISLDLALCHIFYQYCQNSLRLIRHIMKKKKYERKVDYPNEKYCIFSIFIFVCRNFLHK